MKIECPQCGSPLETVEKCRQISELCYDEGIDELHAGDVVDTYDYEFEMVRCRNIAACKKTWDSMEDCLKELKEKQGVEKINGKSKI